MANENIQKMCPFVSLFLQVLASLFSKIVYVQQSVEHTKPADGKQGVS